MSNQQISKMWCNAFYCGVNINALLGENIIEGNWLKLITD
jgi:hypothetical protein